MMLPREQTSFEKDVLDFYEFVIKEFLRAPKGMATKVFEERIMNRLEELVIVARQLQQKSYARDEIVYQCYECHQIFSEEEEALDHYYELGHESSGINWDDILYRDQLHAYRRRQSKVGEFNRAMQSFYEKNDR